MGIRSTLAGFLVLFVGTAAHAGPYSDLIVFGDSLSDVGNTDTWTLGGFPGSDYFDGRFSNGPTYAERLSAGLGLGGLTTDTAGGDNYAYGGAETDGPGGVAGFFLNSLVEQVDDYLDRIDGSVPDPDTLFVFFIGANNLLDGRTDTSGPATDVRQQMQRLVNAGASQLLGINLPELGLTPRFNGNATTAAARTATAIAYNDALSVVFETIEDDNAGVVVHRLDVQALFNDLVADPTPLGFINTTQEGQSVAGSSLDRAPGYVFWDDVHPTREVHALLGEAAIRAVLPAGDYDRDGQVTADDYSAWQVRYGVAFNAAAGQTPSLAGDGNGDGRLDAADYTLWRDRFSQPTNGVPEPASLLLAALLFLATRSCDTRLG